MSADREKFRKNWWRSRVVSSRGFSVRIAGRTGLDYNDRLGTVRLDSESLNQPFGVVLILDSIPDTPERPRAEVIDNISRAFAWAGWHLEVIRGGM
jgi:hypothetical protein